MSPCTQRVCDRCTAHLIRRLDVDIAEADAELRRLLSEREELKRDDAEATKPPDDALHRALDAWAEAEANHLYPVEAPAAATHERERAIVRAAVARAASFITRKEDMVALHLHGSGVDEVLAAVDVTHPRAPSPPPDTAGVVALHAFAAAIEKCDSLDNHRRAGRHSHCGGCDIAKALRDLRAALPGAGK